MAEKKSTLVLNVDLDCHPCKMKMTKALRKFPEIKSQIFDKEQKKVTISGSFDPEKLIKKLYCKVGCKIITGYGIPEPPASSKDKRTVSSPVTTTLPNKQTPSKPEQLVPGPVNIVTLPNKQTPSKPEPLVPGPVNIVIGPIGPVYFCRPTCHCNGSRVNCQGGCGCSSHSNGSRGNCQCGCGGKDTCQCGSRGNCQCGCGGKDTCQCRSRGNCQCGCEGKDTCQCGSRGNCQCGRGGKDTCQCGRKDTCQCGRGGCSNSNGSQGNCQCGCGGQSSCRFLIEEKEGCIIM